MLATGAGPSVVRRCSGGSVIMTLGWCSPRAVVATALVAVVATIAGVQAGAAAIDPLTGGGWRPQTAPQLNGRRPVLYSLALFDPQTAWAAGSQGPANVALLGEVIKTTDGGATWTVQYAPSACCEIVSIAAASAIDVSALQTLPARSGFSSQILYSSNGGRAGQRS